MAWVTVDDLSRTLDAATYLEPTRHLRAAGWSLTLIAAGSGGARRLRGVDVVEVPRSEGYLLGHVAFHRAVHSELRRRRPDIVLFHPDSAPYLIPLRLRGWGAAWRPLLMMDTRTLSMTRATLRARVREAYYTASHWCANRWAHGQTVITRRMAQAVSVPGAQLCGVWPSGVDVGPFGDAAQGRVWPGPSEVLELIYIGALWRERNLPQMAEAACRAKDEGAAVRFTLVGDGPFAAELSQIAKRSGQAIRVLPPVPHELVPRLLAEAHVGVLPFPDQEIFRVSSPIKLFEYLASGLAILATRIVCHTDVLPREAAYVFWAEEASVRGLTEAIHRTVAARDSLSALSAVAQARAVEYDWRAVAAGLGEAMLRLWQAGRRVGART